MVPTGLADGPHLAAVLPSCVAAMRGDGNPLRLRPVRSVVVALVDGLGTANLRERSGHARTLAAALGRFSTARTGGPTTTAAAITSLTTGTSPGQHGVVGYAVLDPSSDRVVNQLSGWGSGAVDPATWQRVPTVFERESDIRSYAIGQSRYRSSGFTSAALRGAEYLAADDIAGRFEAALDVVGAREASLSYLYVPELDMAAHAAGTSSDRWIAALEALEAAVSDTVRSLPPDVALLLTADHGVLDVAESSHVLIDERPDLVDGVRHVGGDPRLLSLYLEPDLPGAARAALVERWRDAEGERAWILTRDEAVAAGVFGEVDIEVLPRIGDILVGARAPIAYYDSRVATAASRQMIGQHGSFTAREREVPLLRFGAAQS
nr:alkaline phosphatase family protein [Herbiconiux sp. L3-i23]